MPLLARLSPCSDDRGAGASHFREVRAGGGLPIEDNTLPAGERTVRIRFGEPAQQCPPPCAAPETRAADAGRGYLPRLVELGRLDDCLPPRLKVGDGESTLGPVRAREDPAVGGHPYGGPATARPREPGQAEDRSQDR